MNGGTIGLQCLTRKILNACGNRRAFQRGERDLTGLLFGGGGALQCLGDKLLVLHTDDLLQVPVKHMDLDAGVLQVLDPLTIHRGVGILNAHPHLLDARQDDPFGTA
jgi:hypothetical protein